MDMPIDSKKIADKVKKVGANKTFAISVNTQVMTDFKKECDRREIKVSPTIEELLREFIEDSQKKK